MRDDIFHRESRLCMGSLLEITLYGDKSEQCSHALEASFAEARRLEELLSPFREDSELSRLNHQASKGPVTPDPELFDLLQKALFYTRITGGAFDIAVWPLMKLWGFRGQETLSAPPDPGQIQATLRSLGSHKVHIDPSDRSVYYRAPGVRIELGAMGKGYAVDQIVRVIRAHQISNALIHLGSTTYALGNPPGKEGWRIAVRHPKNRETMIQVLTLKDCAISTSGDYEQSVWINDRRYGHILDPRNGYPVSQMSSTSVISRRSALEADVLSTAAFVMGPEDGLEFLEKRSGVEGLLAAEREVGKLEWFQTYGWADFDLKLGYRFALTRRTFLTGLFAASVWFILGPHLGHATVYLTREDALQRLIPQADYFKEELVHLTPSQREEVQRLLGKRIPEPSFTFWVAQKSGSPTGYAIILDVIGKEQPITFMVGVSPEGTVLGVEVLIYRESQGSEIRSAGFMKQFVNKTLNAPLRLGRDIHSISGATLSSRSTAYAVKKALALIQVVYLRSGPGAP